MVYLCDSIFLQIQEDICIFQAEDTLLRFYIWDNSWLHSHKNTKVSGITGYSLVQLLTLYIIFQSHILDILNDQ